MAALRHQLRPGAYCDSIVLLEVQKAMGALPGVLDAGAVMATEVNLALLGARDLLPAGLPTPAPDDLLVVVRAESEAAAAEALGQVDGLLARRRTSEGGDYRPKSLAAAARLLPEARWVLVSVPGRWAARVAREALALGRHVFLFSDNVPLVEEVALKGEAARRGLLVLGPDCGTAIVGGVGFGFANRVRRGSVGLVAASGTGLQAVASRLHALGAGVSQALGTGGRDLAAEVGARTALQGLDLLARDPETRVIVLLSKPPAPEVAARLLAAARAAGKPVVVYFQGSTGGAGSGDGLHAVASLEEAAERACELLLAAGGELEERREPAPASPTQGPPAGAPAEADSADRARESAAPTAGSPARAPAKAHGPDGSAGPKEPRYLRALFSGGTLAYEALLALSSRLAPLHSNLAVPGVLPLADLARSQGHTVLDLGDDALTVGRLHPMLDPSLLVARLRQEAGDPAVGAILFDVVLGDGAHPDPASELAPAAAEIRARRADLTLVAILVGTDLDPQGLVTQAERLEAAGARVVEGVGEAIGLLVSAVAPEPAAGFGASANREGTAGPGRASASGPEPEANSAVALESTPPVPLEALGPPVAALNVGLESFHSSLLAQGAASLHVEWRPPAGGDERLLALLDRMRG